jgi:hypothetical protein
MKKNGRQILIHHKIAPVFLYDFLISVLSLSGVVIKVSGENKLLFLGNKNIAPVICLENGNPS